MKNLAPVLLISTLFAIPALAMPNQMFQGKPDFTAGAQLGAWVWHDDNGQHVRFTTADNKVWRRFSGKVCGQNATAVVPVRTDVGDAIRVGPEGHCVVFDFKTNAGMDGFDFRMADGDIVYNIDLDGAPMAVEKIHIGAAAVSPKNSPFSLNRNEK